ncbi:uncharacterized protein BDW43DRAFT_321037 [Aspergillus alliaceus]|uniref:uncharacterized protein n=1 Tax=Petromyces alliaceus TaxID=209559 RepID=UPI0012A436C5|nr:uncharacterized protein BDW43DRAFT_321037 [Aspergillus alliaceus]KAB8230791.1 hypothetical protein BDW43DRAFT_321037 [Aspergillus alliaceus]
MYRLQVCNIYRSSIIINRINSRQCAYATTPKSTPKLRVVLYRAPGSISFFTSDNERQSFNFFLHQTRYRFPLDFSHPVLRASHTEEALARAIISFSALQQLYEYGDDPHLQTPFGQFAMRQYGKAIRILRLDLQTRTSDITLICCLLFACFESTRGCRRAAVIHIKSGLEILQQSQIQLPWTVVSQQTMKFLFTRLDNQLVGLLGTSLSRTLKQGDARPSSVLAQIHLNSNQKDVHHSLDGVLNYIFHERLDMALAIQNHPVPVPNRPVERSQTTQYLKGWYKLFTQIMLSPHRETEAEINYMYEDDHDLMRIWYTVGRMYDVVTREQDSENVWDRFLSEFETIVVLAEKYLGRMSQCPRKRMFSFSLGVVSPLYVVGVRCRDSVLRRRAIWLLESCERREMLWDSRATAQTARRVMELEEAAAIEQKSVGWRVKNVTAVLDDEDGAVVEIE